MTRSRLRKLRRVQTARGRRAVATLPLAAAMLALSQGAPAADSTGNVILENVIVTAQKRVEDLQNVPVSVQALSSTKLEELNVKSFDDYVKFLPSVSFTSIGPGFALAYMRGVTSGENNNHSGPQPTVGMYLDEQPITTIQGALDVHLYDIARVEALAGPQGTLYGASSEAGTIRIITNKPDPSKFEAGYDLEGNFMEDGGNGYVAEGFVNIPVGESAAIRLVGWYEEEGGYIDNVPIERTFTTSGQCVVNSSSPPAGCVSTPTTAKNDQNEVKTYGARAALRIDLNDSWTITPALMAQKQTTDGFFAYDKAAGDLKVARYYPDDSEDKWMQAALTVEGKIGNFDLVYAGAYLKRDDVVNSDYSDYSYFYDLGGSGVYWTDDDGVPLGDPSQFIHGTDKYKRQSHEIRLSSPADQRLRFLVGAFYQFQEHEIFQNYQIAGLGSDVSVTNWPGTIWLTNQHREDEDYALFGEVSFDITEHLTLTGGLRTFKAKNSLNGFFGFSSGYSSNYGEDLCFSPEQFRGSPCVNLDDSVSDEDTIPRVNLSYRFDDDVMVYATYSRGFRPGGINRNGTVPPYKPDYLDNYELGWKTVWGGNRVRFNGAVFLEKWDDIQFSFLPPSGAGLTVIRNAGSAEIKGIEMDLAWAASEILTLSGGMSYLDAKLTEDYIPDPEEPPTASDGTQLPITPEFKANLTARFVFPVGQLNGSFQGSAVYQGSSWSDLQDADRAALGKQPSYTIADFSAGVGRDSYTVELFVNNAFDERAEFYKFAACATDVCTIPYIVTNQPRTVGLRFGQKF
ncbi:TonB-dependent receptor [Povalibacter sp.]|uniref:TonB-dependent receptor n=1 Tax=Povalibacter sp. TaxID=1962978 RepID=UPI002F415174